ncbi:hypothetical protein LCGC14_2814860, partial [marine sediment metagenome]
IETPVFPRWIWMEEITYSHIPIATIITAFMVLAPIYEYIGYRRKDPRFERLAKGLIWFVMILFSPGAALGTGIAVFIIGAYPEFWSRWANLFFWPLIWQFGFFLLEVSFLFFGYYLTWQIWSKRKRLHIAMGAAAAACGLLVQLVWDSLGGYMLTPGAAPLPAVDQPGGLSVRALMNPSFPFLFTHRFFGNISYAMLLTGGVLALRWMRAKDPKDKAYFDFAANLTFAVGLLAFFAMPVIGWFYARVIQAEAPIAFAAIMGGHTAPHFTVKMGLILGMLLLAGTYLCARHRKKALPVAVTAGTVGLVWVVWIHPPLDWVGGRPELWKPVAMAVLAAMAGATGDAPLTIAGLGLRNAARRPGRSLAVVALLACGSFLIVAVGANRLDASAGAADRASGTGGFALLG